jgi:hypothetical protein
MLSLILTVGFRGVVIFGSSGSSGTVRRWTPTTSRATVCGSVSASPQPLKQSRAPESGARAEVSHRCNGKPARATYLEEWPW